MHIIFVRGGCPMAPRVAKLCQMEYGIRHDYVAYGEVYMLDIKFKHRRRPPYLWHQYMARVRELRPQLAMSEDYGIDYSPRAHTLIRSRMTRQVADLRAAGVPQIMVCPKFPGAVRDIPTDCRVAVSVATGYSGFEPEMEELRGRECHLLGGDPRRQVEIVHEIKTVGGRVVSVDGNMMWMKAEHGQWFSRDGRWIQTRRHRWPTQILAIISGLNIVRLLRAASGGNS